MRKIRLLRTDLPQEPELTLDTEDATSEVIIGRGTTLRCDDKRVSRNHCSLRILPDGGVLLIARHSNPCFYKVQSQSAIFTLLSRNESITLYQGDEFSLLPESFRYRISTHREQNGDGDPADLEPSSEMLETTIDNSGEVNIGAMNETSPAMDSTSETKQSLSRLVLPDWLANLPESTSTPLPINARKRKLNQQENQMDKKQKNLNNETCRANTNVQNEQALGSLITEPGGSINVLEREITGARVTSNSPLPQLATEMMAGNVQSGQSNNKDDCEENWGVDDLVRVKIEPGVENQRDTEPVVNPVTIKEEPVKEEPVKEEPVDDTLNAADADQGASCSNTTAPTATAAATREMCMYGVACYRRNPQHRNDFSHPGDPDYDAAADDLPECEYGTSCYRKNVQHRKDFKHTKKMSPPPQPRPRPQQANNTARLGDTSDEDEYDLNDSFLNDASSDDYQPSGSSGSDEDSEGAEDSLVDSQPTPEKKKKRKGRKPK